MYFRWRKCVRLYWNFSEFYSPKCPIDNKPALVQKWLGVRTGDKPWWRHQMQTLFALLSICAGNSPVTGEFLARGQWRRALMLSLICARINGWVNNRKAGDLRRHRAHYDVILMRQAIVSSNDGLTTVIYASLGLVEFVRSRDNFLYMGANSKWRVRFRRHFNVWRHPDTTIIWYWMGTPQQFEICVASGKWPALRTR